MFGVFSVPVFSYVSSVHFLFAIMTLMFTFWFASYFCCEIKVGFWRTRKLMGGSFLNSHFCGNSMRNFGLLGFVDALPRSEFVQKSVKRYSYDHHICASSKISEEKSDWVVYIAARSYGKVRSINAPKI